MNYDHQKEIDEAIAAGERALSSLAAAEKSLASAKNWGLVDLLGGGMLTTFVKRSRMQEASRYLEEAREDLRSFASELSDVEMPDGSLLNGSDFLTFADYFFDGFVADFLVQSRIQDTRRKIEQTAVSVRKIVDRLKNGENPSASPDGLS